MPDYTSPFMSGVSQGQSIWSNMQQMKAAKQAREQAKAKFEQDQPNMAASQFYQNAPEGMQMNREEVIRALAASKAAKDAQAKRGQMPPGFKLGMDQRWNPETESVEILPGSKTYLGQKDKWAKDQGVMRGIDTQAGEGIGKIDYILDPKNAGGFESQFGGPQSYLTRMMPGQTQDVGAKLESLKSNLKLAGKSLVGQGGAIGQITEREWPILEGMIDTLNPNMTEEGARQVLQNIRAKFEDMKRQSSETYQSEWGGSQFDQQAAPQAKRYQILLVE